MTLVRGNRLTYPGQETTAVLSSPTNCTVSNGSAARYSGSDGILVTSSAAGDVKLTSPALALSNLFFVPRGGTIRLAAAMRAPVVSGRTALFFADWFGGGPSDYLSTSTSEQTTLTSTFAIVSTALTAPAGASYFAFGIQWTGVLAASEVFHVDRIILSDTLSSWHKWLSVMPAMG